MFILLDLALTRPQRIMQFNVLINDNNQPCISDFGLSTLLTEMGGTTFATSSRAVGTLRWAAPELFCLNVTLSEDVEDLPDILPTPRSDIYSFGGIMIQVCFHPYATKDLKLKCGIRTTLRF